MICKANQLTGFYMKWVCTERYFRIDYTHNNCIILKNLSRLLCDMVKHELRVTSCKLRVTNYELKA